MKILITLLATRLRAKAFGLVSRGLARLLMALVASRLRPATARAAAPSGRRAPAGDGRTIDGEYRRLRNDR